MDLSGVDPEADLTLEEKLDPTVNHYRIQSSKNNHIAEVNRYYKKSTIFKMFILGIQTGSDFFLKYDPDLIFFSNIDPDPLKTAGSKVQTKNV